MSPRIALSLATAPYPFLLIPSPTKNNNLESSFLKKNFEKNAPHSTHSRQDLRRFSPPEMGSCWEILSTLLPTPRPRIGLFGLSVGVSAASSSLGSTELEKNKGSSGG